MALSPKGRIDGDVVDEYNPPERPVLRHEPGVANALARVVDHRPQLVAGCRPTVREQLRERELGARQGVRHGPVPGRDLLVRVLADGGLAPGRVGALIHRLESDHGASQVAASGVIR